MSPWTGRYSNHIVPYKSKLYLQIDIWNEKQELLKLCGKKLLLTQIDHDKHAQVLAPERIFSKLIYLHVFAAWASPPAALMCFSFFTVQATVPPRAEESFSFALWQSFWRQRL